MFTHTFLRARASGATVCISALATTALLSGCASGRIDKVAQVATGISSHLVCSGHFISGTSVGQAVEERLRPLQGMGLALRLMRFEVDDAAREVRVRLAGGFASRAWYRPGLGCLVLHEGDQIAPEGVANWSPVRPEAAKQKIDFRPLEPSAPAHEALQGVLASAFRDEASPPFHHTKALLVLRDGRLLAERYAPGVGPDTVLPGFSMSKAMMHALTGLLVRRGRLKLDQKGLLPAWRDPSDPRHAITLDDVLRQVTGLDLVQDNSGFDASTQILFNVHDKGAAIAAAGLSAVPGRRWAYADTNYLLLSRLIRDAAGGTLQDVLDLARDELFAPLGMSTVMLSPDATGTPGGASFFHASARDWARLGQLYLDKGRAGDQQILPAGWTAHAASRTLDTGYGAGFWTNLADGNVPGWGVHWGLPSAPKDTYFARGFQGQFVVIVPSERLVMVRLSASGVKGDDIDETDRVLAGILKALQRP